MNDFGKCPLIILLVNSLSYGIKGEYIKSCMNILHHLKKVNNVKLNSKEQSNSNIKKGKKKNFTYTNKLFCLQNK